MGTVHSAMLVQIAAAGRPVELVAVADRVPERRRLLAATYGFARQFDDGLTLVKETDLDAVFVCTPTVSHAAIVHAAAARGLHLFCEKPLGMSAAEGDGMVAAIDRAGVQAQIGLVLRFSAVYTVMRDLLCEPEAGEPVAVVFRDDQVFPVRGLHATGWRGDRTQSAGGTLIEHGVHDLDLLTWMFGPIARLRAWEQNRAGVPGIEDYVAVDVTFTSGLRAQLVSIWHDMLQRPSNRRLEVFCRRAFVASEADMHGDVVMQRGDDAETRLAADEVLRRFLAHHPDAPEALRPIYGVSYLVQDLAFVDALLAGRPVAPTLHEGLAAQHLAERVYEAARTGEEVVLAAVPPAPR
ncbi:MAG: Gfo/Idh/MocA family oxidoreductase [bacterium]|nr:Gfo/Idh/MocA family oxidoreductase [bacterium]